MGEYDDFPANACGATFDRVNPQMVTSGLEWLGTPNDQEDMVEKHFNGQKRLENTM